MNDIYMRIENLCKKREIDITTMCKEASVSRAIMSEFKMGRTKKLSTDTLEKLSNYFSVPIDYLLTGETKEQKNKPHSINAAELSEKERILVNIAKGFTDEQYQALIVLAKSFQKPVEKEPD